MADAVGRLVRDGDALMIDGFTHLICFAAGHEIIRQRRRELTLCRMTPDLIYDQLIAAGGWYASAYRKQIITNVVYSAAVSA